MFCLNLNQTVEIAARLSLPLDELWGFPHNLAIGGA
jgi:hypothetical protein